MIIVKSTVLSAPENRVSVDGHAVLILTLDGRPGWPFEVRIPFGYGPDSQLQCAAYAARIGKGMHVTVEAASSTPRTDHGPAVNVLREAARVDVRSDTECFVVPGLLR